MTGLYLFFGGFVIGFIFAAVILTIAFTATEERDH